MTDATPMSTPLATPLATPPGFDESNQRLVRTVDTLSEEDLRAPSLLPDWSRAHVVAHLTLNAEGFTRALEGITEGEPRTIYDSGEKRNADIVELSQAGADELRERLFASITALDEAAGALTAEQRQVPVERTPDSGPMCLAGEVLGKRWAEIEVHHADLGAAYSHADWPAAFSLDLLENMRRRSRWSTDFTAQSTDLEATWRYGSPDADSPVVSGPSHALAWWISGRGSGDGLVSSTGALPEIGAW